MEKKRILTRLIGFVGAVLVWIPILAPVFFSLLLLIDRGIFRFDYLMPAEFFPLVLLGGILLLWAAFREHAWQRLIGWGLGLAAGLLVAIQGLAVATGLASGAREPVGFWFGLVTAFLGVYILAVIALGVGGGLLVHRLFRPDVPAG